MAKFIYNFSQVSIKDVGKVGGKNASLGEMIRKLSKKGIAIPDGFCTSAEAFIYFLEYNNIRQPINKILLKLGKNKGRKLAIAGQEIRQMVVRGKFPVDLEKQIILAYLELSKKYPPKADQPLADKNTNLDVAVRSSATAEDLSTASFAGQQASYL